LSNARERERDKKCQYPGKRDFFLSRRVAARYGARNITAKTVKDRYDVVSDVVNRYAVIYDVVSDIIM
jgi:hypothetical protein